MTNDFAKAHVFANGHDAMREVALWNEDGFQVAEILDHINGYNVKLTLHGHTYYIG